MKKTDQKKLLILGGTYHMIDVVQTATRMGFYTIVTDNMPDSPAKEYADASYEISTAAIEELSDMARAEKVDGVFTAFEDINTWNAEKLCRELNLPFYATKEQLGICSNKDKFKAFCRHYDVPVIEEYQVTDGLRETELTQLPFPVIVKPVDSYASKGITICQTPEETREAYRKALRFSSSKNVIIERFVDTEYGVQLFYTVQNGKVILSGTVDRYVHKEADDLPPLPIAMIFPSRHQGQYLATVDKRVRNMISGMGIQNGLLFIQTLYENGEFYIYEMGFRFSGEQHYHIINKQTGINLLEMMLDHAVGNSLEQYDLRQYDNGYTPFPAGNFPILLTKGTIDRVIGLEKIKSMPSFASCTITRHVGDTIDSIGTYSQMLGRFNFVAQSTEELFEAVNTLYDKLEVQSTEQKNMVTTRFYAANAIMQ